MFSYFKLLYYLLRPNTVFVRRTSNGLGDNLLLSAILPELRRQHPDRKIVVETPWPELFKNNPHVDWVTDKHMKTTSRHIRPKYHVDENTAVPICDQVMSYVRKQDTGFPELYLSEEEVNRVGERFDFSYVTVCPTGKTAFCANRKEWGIDNFQVLRGLLHDYRFVQIGLPSDPILEDVIDGRDLSVRGTAAAIRNSLFFLGLEGGLMHLAKSAGKRSVIIYGGFIRPELSAYEENLNIYQPVACSPCFHSDYPHEPCESMVCMKSITPEMVYDMMKREFLARVTSEV